MPKKFTAVITWCGMSKEDLRKLIEEAWCQVILEMS